jgi:hypothetical protein
MRGQIINNIIRVLLGTVITFSVLALNGCIFGTPDDQGGDVTPGLESPAGVVEMIEVAYNDTDVELYKKCLSQNFTFYFDPNDVGNDVEGYIIPDSWGYYDEIDAADNMFDNAYSIQLSIITNNIGEPEPSDEDFLAPNVMIELTVMIDSQNGFKAKGPVDFEFESYFNDKNEKQWRVINWWDRTWS